MMIVDCFLFESVFLFKMGLERGFWEKIISNYERAWKGKLWIKWWKKLVKSVLYR